jgi:hypothetical protein
MPTTTNLYADKLLSEHPLAVWALDDTSDYISLISESFRNISLWTPTNTNGSPSLITNNRKNITAPFPSSYITQINGATSAGTSTLVSNSTFTSDAVGFTVSFYIQSTVDITIKVGYTGITSLQKTIYGSKYPTETWIPVSFTFYTQATSKNLKIELVYGSANPVFFINGLTIGKDSEPFNGESFGQSLITLPTSIATTQTNGIEAKSYGTEAYSAYYIGSGKDLYAKNSGMSMSYGSGSSMIAYAHPTSGQPSFIFPGFGFLNESGRYRELTLETFIRINANNTTPKRIIGPLASTDGVYVTKEFISLKIGDNVESYYLSELYRPMLLQVKVGENYAILSIDGEDVLSVSVETSKLSLPAYLNGSSKNQDWIGIFAYSDVKFIEVDSIAIYPYRCSNILAKTRFAYAQAIDVPQEINVKYGGNTILADYGFTNYTNNYNYPSFQAKWEQASIRDNFDISSSQSLYASRYDVPESSVSLYTSSLWLKDLYATNVASGDSYTFINLKPSTVVSGSGRSWSSNQGYIYSSSFNKNEHLSNCIYGIFKSLENSGTEQILIKILNNSTQDYIKISLTNTTVTYSISYQGTVSSIATKSITQGTSFAVGIDIKSLCLLNDKVSSFFNDVNSLELYIGGQVELTNTFSGNIYKIGMCSSRNFDTISSLFSSGVLTNGSSYSTLLPKTVSYTIVGVNSYQSIILDIGTNSYWQDYVPLNKLSKSVDNDDETITQELDFIQVNIDYPETRTYSSNNFDTSNSELKTYISFQTSTSSTIKQASEFATTVSANKNRVIDASTFSSTTKYEFVNGMIIYPPKDINFETLNLVVHLELNSSAINLKPYDIRFLQFAAKTLESNNAQTEVNPIGTRYSVNLYPYKYSNNFYDYKSINPYLVYKDDSPYLYLTKHSGIRVCGDYDSAVDRGLYVNIGNPSLSIKINSLQMSILADIKEFSSTGIKIFEIQSSSETIPFYVKSLNSSNTKGIIYTSNTTNNIPIYYLNGKIVADPVIELDEWNILGLSFLTPIDLSESTGKIKITSDILLDNISYYGLDLVNNSQKIAISTWDTVDNGAWNTLGTWKYSSLSDYYKIYDNGVKDIYKNYTGTDKILADTSSNTKNIEFNGYKYIGYMDIERNTITLNIA